MATRMTPADAVWYLGENRCNPMMISSMLWFDRRMDVDGLRARYQERMIDRHPVFRQRIVPSRTSVLLPKWEDDPHFDLDDHVTVVEMAPPGDHATLEDLCSVERSTPLDRSRPMWHVTVYQGYRGTGSAVHTRIHHSIGDGLALMQLLLTLVDEYEPGSVAITDASALPLSLATGRQVLRSAQAATRMARHPTTVPPAVRQGADLTRWGVKLLLPTMADRSQLIGHPSGEKRMSWDPDGWSLDEIKAAAAKANGTINDLVLAIMAGALHRYLAHRDGLVDDVLMYLPVNMRPPGEPLPRHLGNRIGLLPIKLPVGLTDPEDRLAVVQARMAALKRSPAPVVSHLLLAATSLATPVGERGIHRMNQVRSTGVLTNVPGPRQPLHLAGARILGSVGWGGMTGHLNVSAAFVSLGGRIFSGLVTDRAITPDPERLEQYLQEEWRRVVPSAEPAPAMVVAADGDGAARPRPRPRKRAAAAPTSAGV